MKCEICQAGIFGPTTTLCGITSARLCDQCVASFNRFVVNDPRYGELLQSRMNYDLCRASIQGQGLPQKALPYITQENTRIRLEMHRAILLWIDVEKDRTVALRNKTNGN